MNQKESIIYSLIIKEEMVAMLSHSIGTNKWNKVRKIN